MTNEYNIFLRLARWVRRFRKRRGYGVHSPFAFDFITGVVYNANAYYAYERLRKPLVASIARLDEYDPESGLTAKDLRLLFRLTNWAEPTTITLLGASPTLEAYIRAARPSAVVVSAPAASPAPATPPAPSASSSTHLFIYSDSADRLPVGRELTAASVVTIVVRGIHIDAAASAQWEQLKHSPLCTVSFDLGRFGIIVKVPKINPQHYIVNYF